MAITCLGQGKDAKYGIDFSGRWKSISITRDTGDLPMPPDERTETEFIIAQTGHELRLMENSKSRSGVVSREATYYLDGRGESNKGFGEQYKFISKTSIKKKKLVIDATITIDNSKEKLYKTEEWSLSDDGKTLKIETKSGGLANRYDPNSIGGTPIRHYLTFKRVN